MIGYSPTGWYSIAETLDGALNEPFLTVRVLVGVDASASISALPEFEVSASAVLTPVAAATIISTTRLVDCTALLSTEVACAIASTNTATASAVLSLVAEPVFSNQIHLQCSALVSVTVPSFVMEVANTANVVASVSLVCSGAITTPVSMSILAAIPVSLTGAITTVFRTSDGSVTTILNTTTGGAAEYTDYNYDSFFRLGSAYYGCSDAGITLLDGAIPVTLGWEVSTAITDMGSAQIKYVPDSTVILRTESMVELAELVDEQIERTNMQIPCDGKAGLHGRRVLMPKGVHGTEWQFTWSGVGVAAEIKEFSVDPVYSKRTVR